MGDQAVPSQARHQFLKDLHVDASGNADLIPLLDDPSHLSAGWRNSAGEIICVEIDLYAIMVIVMKGTCILIDDESPAERIQSSAVG